MTLQKKNVVSLPFRVQYLLQSDIAGWIRYNFNYAHITLAAGKAWRDFYTTPGSIEFVENSNKTADGIFYATELKQFYPGTDPSADLEIKRLEHQGLILLVMFSDGVNRIIGSPGKPVRIKTDLESTAKKSGVTIISSKRSADGSQFYDPDYTT